MKSQIMWAWYDNDRKQFCYIYKDKYKVEMCSPDGFKYKEKTKQGKITKVIVTEYNIKIK